MPHPGRERGLTGRRVTGEAPGVDAPAEPREPWSFTYEDPIHAVFPALHEAQRSWLGQIDSLAAPDRRTHELIRLACAVVARSEVAVRRHARLAAEVGATWDDVLGAVMLTCPTFGVLPAVEAIPHARSGFDAASAAETDDDPEDDDV